MKLKNKKEIDHELDFVAEALKKGCRAWKLVFLARKGFPDRIVLCPGARVCFMEFKRGNNERSPHQDKYKKILEGLGFKYYTPYTTQEAVEYLNAFLDS